MRFMSGTVVRAAVMSIVAAGVLATLPSLGRAHEVAPTIGDLSHADGRVELVLRMNAEAFVAGIDLDDLQDTNDSAADADYDALRALSPDAFTDRLRAALPQILPGIALRADGTALPLTAAGIVVQDPGNTDLARQTIVTLEGALPAGTKALQLGWAKGYGALVLRQQGPDLPFTGMIAPGGQSPDMPLAGQGAAKTAFAAFVEYIPVGFDHIVPKGLDHILFVLALFFLSTRLSTLLWQVSAFTLAHTITLAAGALGWVAVPGYIVEPLIAASIAFVAVENVLNDRLSRWRPLVIFGFGLLHGLGFASVLADFGLPEDQFIPALIGFNVGVEVGQLAVIAAAFLAVGLWFGRKTWYRAWISIPASVAIGLVGAFWVLERTVMA